MERINYNYSIICQSHLLKDLAERPREVIIRRFGLGWSAQQTQREKETLESIGKSYGITRERVRQIEEEGMKRLEKKITAPPLKKILQYFIDYFKTQDNIKKEDILLNELGKEKFNNYIFFLLTLAKPFERYNETNDFYALWTIDKNSFSQAKKNINSFIENLKKKNQPLPAPSNLPLSHLEISKHILRGEGLYGLKNWPEINPRSVKDKAYVIFKKQKRPLHFKEVFDLINNQSSSIFSSSRPVVIQTVHNELIRDRRFILVGRGLYALEEWGYQPGAIREVIARVLEEANRPLKKEEIIEKVLAQRQVKVNTILLNLQNKKYFLKNSQGEYILRKR